MTPRLTPAARDDLSSIWDYTRDHWGTPQAEAYVRNVAAAIDRVDENPFHGRPCDEIRQGYRRTSAGSHVIFYLPREDSVDVIRILHQRMDPERHVH